MLMIEKAMIEKEGKLGLNNRAGGGLRSVACPIFYKRTLLNVDLGISSPAKPKRALSVPTSMTTPPVSSCWGGKKGWKVAVRRLDSLLL